MESERGKGKSKEGEKGKGIKREEEREKGATATQSHPSFVRIAVEK